MSAPAPFAAALYRRIEAAGALPVAEYMAACNAHYYATRDPLGRAGDFTTAPEISQMFGELIGLCLADLWTRAGRPQIRLVELGPGRGTLSADALRAMRAAGLVPASIELVETSPAMRERQAERLPGARWHDHLETVPTDLPWLGIANEFFDALPIEQIIRTEAGWRERTVRIERGSLNWSARADDAADRVPPSLRDGPIGSVVERCPLATMIAHRIGAGVSRHGGAFLVIDYGYAGPLAGETLQAVRRHAHADPLAEPGEQDLTAHVDFAPIRAGAAAAGARVLGPVAQGIFLDRLGIDRRAMALRRRNPDAGAAIEAARARLTLPDAMGSLFKTLAIMSPHWPDPAGFA